MKMQPKNNQGQKTKDIRNISSTGAPERNLSEDLPRVSDHLARYAFAAHWALGQRVADICCGVGYGSNLLAAAGAVQVYGIDICPEAVEEAQRLYTNDVVQFLCADVTETMPISEVDVAVCFEGIEHVISPELFLKNIAASLVEDGVALFSTPNAASFPGGHSGNPHHLHEYHLSELEGLLSRYFKQVKMYYQWCLRDPYDFRWNLLSLGKALVPVSFKHAFRSWLWRRRSVEAVSERPIPLGIAARYRPYPTTYLSLPGLRFQEPPVWLAVCQGPRLPDSTKISAS